MFRSHYSYFMGCSLFGQEELLFLHLRRDVMMTLLYINNRLRVPFGNNTSLLPNVCCVPATHTLPSVTTAWAFTALSVGAVAPPEVGELDSSARGESAWGRSCLHSMLPPVETFGEKNVQEFCVMRGLTV